jgi:hypothetical protein
LSAYIDAVNRKETLVDISDEKIFVFPEEPKLKEKIPTEDEVLKTIYDNVFIRGIDLEDYDYNFRQSDLYINLCKLFTK